MEKSNILSKLKIDIKNYNNELEKILENKLFSYDVKKLLMPVPAPFAAAAHSLRNQDIYYI